MIHVQLCRQMEIHTKERLSLKLMPRKSVRSSFLKRRKNLKQRKKNTAKRNSVQNETNNTCTNKSMAKKKKEQNEIKKAAEKSQRETAIMNAEELFKESMMHGVTNVGTTNIVNNNTTTFSDSSCQILPQFVTSIKVSEALTALSNKTLVDVTNVAVQGLSERVVTNHTFSSMPMSSVVSPACSTVGSMTMSSLSPACSTVGSMPMSSVVSPACSTVGSMTMPSLSPARSTVGSMTMSSLSPACSTVGSMPMSSVVSPACSTVVSMTMPSLSPARSTVGSMTMSSLSPACSTVGSMTMPSASPIPPARSNVSSMHISPINHTSMFSCPVVLPPCTPVPYTVCNPSHINSSMTVSMNSRVPFNVSNSSSLNNMSVSHVNPMSSMYSPFPSTRYSSAINSSMLESIPPPSPNLISPVSSFNPMCSDSSSNLNISSPLGRPCTSIPSSSTPNSSSLLRALATDRGECILKDAQYDSLKEYCAQLTRDAQLWKNEYSKLQSELAYALSKLSMDSKVVIFALNAKIATMTRAVKYKRAPEAQPENQTE